MATWLLIVWTGTHQGYFTVPTIETEAECHRLALVLSNDKKVG